MSNFTETRSQLKIFIVVYQKWLENQQILVIFSEKQR